MVADQILVEYDPSWTELVDADRAPCIFCAEPTISQEHFYCNRCRTIRRRVAHILYNRFSTNEIEGYYLFPRKEWML